MTHARDLQEKIKRVSEKWRAERSSHLPLHANLLFDHSLSAMQNDLDWINQFLQKRARGD